jgi:hypothetical protein
LGEGGIFLRTLLEDRGPVHPHDCGVAIFVFLAVTHGERGQLLSFMNCRRRALGIVAVDVVQGNVAKWDLKLEDISERRVLALI